LLEIAFVVEKGSTGLIAKLINNFKELVKIVPEKHKAIVVISFFLILFTYLGYSKYLDNKVNIEQIKKDKQIADILDKSIEKLGQYSPELSKIIIEQDKNNLNNLSKIDEGIYINKEFYTSKELKEIKKEK
jgi:hypothetical protein